ncbi:MAG: hypothetical protein ABIQ07_00030, partial [Ginsengibacter sp.]
MKLILKFAASILLIGIIFFISCKKVTDGIATPNRPPTGNAGPDQTITLPLDSAGLDGSNSSDADGTITSYKWTKISGPASLVIVNQDSSKTLVKTLVAGLYKFELKVTDNGGLSSKDTVQISVSTTPIPNRSPIAQAGPDQTIALPANSVTLNGTGSTDPDNNITGYTWTKISGPSAFNIANLNAVQTQVNNLVEGVYQFELKVTDVGGLFGTDTVQVTVNPDPSPTLQWQKSLGGTRVDVAQSI